MHDKYSYRVIWSEEDQEYVGLAAEWPSLSWLSKSQEAAFKGIRKLVKESVTDMVARKEVLPEPIATKNLVANLSSECHQKFIAS